MIIIIIVIIITIKIIIIKVISATSYFSAGLYLCC